MSAELLIKPPKWPEEKKSKSLFKRSLLSFATIGGGVFAFLATQLVAALLVTVALATGGLQQSQIQYLFSNNGVLVGVYLLASLLLVGILIIACLAAKKNFLKVIGLSKKPQWSDAAWALLSYAVYFIIFAVIAVVFLPLFKEVIDIDQQQDFGVSLDTNPFNLAALFVMFVVIPPIIEEVLFRGFMYRQVRGWVPRWLATIVISLVFGAMHLELLSGNSPNWIAMIDTTFLSLVLIVLVEKTNSLWPAIYVHALKNFIAYALLVSGVAS